jgi:hypothetical protein
MTLCIQKRQPAEVNTVMTVAEAAETPAQVPAVKHKTAMTAVAAMARVVQLLR